MTIATISSKYVRAIAASALLSGACPALAAIDLPGGNTEGNGDFNLSPFVYGASGSAYLSTLLSVAELSGMAQPQDHTLGTELQYVPPSPTGLGTSVVDLAYSITNTSASLMWNDLRFVIYLDPNGNNTTFMDTVDQSLPAKTAGDFDKHQIGADAFLNPIKPGIQTARAVTDGVNACGGAACDADFGFEWDRPTLAPGETWTITFRMIDDQALVAGGRYLSASSDDPSFPDVLFAGNPLPVPEPETYAMMLAGLGVILLLRRRRT